MLLYIQLEGGAYLPPFIDIAILIKIEWWGFSSRRVLVANTSIIFCHSLLE